ncbi:MAG: gliding motility-associated C-terminal domain-containing protein [Saprospiraceae bacterium]|nr:gliding motility-associated C-terminal domain-containing protein [Candidatus Vicinibacter affinis]
MKFNILIKITIFILISFVNVKSQHCAGYPDSNFCYKIDGFKSLVTRIDKKIEFPHKVYDASIHLLADIDGDCNSELITFSRRGDSIYIIDLVNGITKITIPIKNVNASENSILISDINGNNIPEFIIQTVRNPANPDNFDSDRLICYGLDGSILWISDTTVNAVNNGNARTGAIGICDFNFDGIPEIYTSNKIFNALTGKKLADGGNNGFGYNRLAIGTYIPISVAANLDSDTSDLELAAGFSIYKVMITNPNGMTGNSMIAKNILFNGSTEDGTTSIADINSDGILDVIVSAPTRNSDPILYAYYLDNNSPSLISYASFPNVQQISHASVGNLNNNGSPSIIVNISTKLYSFRFNGSQVFNPDWILNTTDTSGVCGIGIYDIDGDGLQEIIFRDMTDLRILSGIGSTPFVMSQIKCSSPTLREFPTISDYDHTGNIKICVTCTDPFPYRNPRITVFGPPDGDHWAPARGIWNQYAYNPLYINDDLTVPRYQKNQATYRNGKYNNFMQQESLLDSNGFYKSPAASLTGKIQCINYDPITKLYTLTFDLFNRKDASAVADSNLAISFFNGDPTNAGTLIGHYYTLRSIYPGDSLLNLEFKFSARNLSDLFMVINSVRNTPGNFGDQDFLQAECDYTDNISRTIDLPKIDSIHAMICKGSSYRFVDTSIVDAGKYYRKLSSVKGCDSLITILDLTTADTIYINQSIQTCDAYFWNHQTLTQTGIYRFDTINQFGCDSIVNLDLTIHKSNATNIRHTDCDAYSWNGQTYNTGGIYSYKTKNSFGCDSTVTLELTLHHSDSNHLQIETCNSFVWNGRTYTQSGVYTLDTINQFGCDSVVQLNLNINSQINKTIVQTSCDAYQWNGRNYSQSGIYTDTTQSSKGCDSITTLQLTINKSNSSNTVHTTCDRYVWNGNTYTQSGTYTFQTQNASGCDSTATLQLTVKNSTQSEINVASCDKYFWNNVSYTQSGTYQYNTINSSGCDSTAVLNLVIHKSDSLLQKQTACETFVWNNVTYTQSGKYIFQTINQYGCDSIVTLDLNIVSSTKKDTSISICDSIMFLGKNLTSSGNYSFPLTNAAGCDSIVNLNLKINSNYYKQNVIRCDAYVWDLNGKKFDTSGMYSEKYTNSSGCDSIYYLELTIHPKYEFTQQAEACKQYRWPLNNQLLTESGLYTIPLKTHQGCDSILSLDLKINEDFEKRDTVITDTTYTWPVNAQTYDKSGTYQESFRSTVGCDSLHYLYLLIKKNYGIYYPNIIYPGGVNNGFTLFDDGSTIAQITKLSIYDRWGSQVWQQENFAANDPSLGWDGSFKGKAVVPGVYVWHAQLTLQDGSVISWQGEVTVVR